LVFFIKGLINSLLISLQRDYTYKVFWYNGIRHRKGSNMIGKVKKRYIKSDLPDELRVYFWDCDFDELIWKKYSFFITERLLNFGNIKAIKWLMGMTNQITTIMKI
jgi:hypothetical protein